MLGVKCTWKIPVSCHLWRIPETPQVFKVVKNHPVEEGSVTTSLDPETVDLANRLILAVQHLAAGESGWRTALAVLTPLTAIIAAIVAAIVGWRNLKQQQDALDATVRSAGRAEWWTRTQWALDASASANAVMSTYGATMLDLLAESKMAKDEDMALLDAVWKGTTSGMNDEAIQALVTEAGSLVDIPEEQKASIQNFFDPVRAANEETDTSLLTKNDGSPVVEDGDMPDVTGIRAQGQQKYKEQVLARLHREILAARLKVTVDKRLARETSATVRSLAGMELPPLH